MKTVALIPARSGSKRIPHKNIKELGGNPLIAYAIAGAKASGLFESIVVSTDSPKYANIAEQWGAEVIMRPKMFAGDMSPDFEWVSYTLDRLEDSGRKFEIFSILRPTSPFRTADTIKRAFGQLMTAPVDSLRAVELVSQHPGKMWVLQGKTMIPLMPLGGKEPWHSRQTATLPEIFVQNASLEIAWTRAVMMTETISGYSVMPFFTQGYEGFDLNTEKDWQIAESLVSQGVVTLPGV